MRTIITICAIAECLTAIAQVEAPDTVYDKELGEVVIEAAMQRTSSKSSTYIPLQQQKKSATDGVSLLSQMAIPQLDVDLANMSIKTVSGNPVSIYINYVAASKHDLSGMRPTDVQRVEYLLYPQDPRFKGAQYVVNIIVQKYEWGGYTKLSAAQKLIVNNTDAGVYSKFAINSITFDVYADEQYSSNRHGGEKLTEQFSFTDLIGEGARQEERVTTPLASLSRSNTNSVAFRALYATDKMQISNMLSFSNKLQPHSDLNANVTYTNNLFPDSRTIQNTSVHNQSLNYDFELYSALSDKVAINIETSYNYNYNTMESHYDDGSLTIDNNAGENSHFAKVTPALVWNINRHNSLMPLMFAEYDKIKVGYAGNSPSRQSYDIIGLAGGIRYAYSQDNLSAGAMLWWIYAHTDFSGTKTTDNYPTGNLFATYSFNDKHQIELAWALAKEIPETYQKSPNMLRQDDLIWYMGSPGLDNYWMQRVNINYLWLPNNHLQFAADGYYHWENNKIVTLYTPDAPEGTLLRRYANNGNSATGMIGLSATAKFFKSKLVAKVRPQYTHRRITGEYDQSTNWLTCTAQLTCYFGNFYLYGWYSTPSSGVLSDSGVRGHHPSRYQIQIGWGKGAWRATATAYNFFRSSWETSRVDFKSPYYGYEGRNYGVGSHRSFGLSVTYMLGYGKKVRRGNELDGVGEGKSAILK